VVPRSRSYVRRIDDRQSGVPELRVGPGLTRAERRHHVVRRRARDLRLGRNGGGRSGRLWSSQRDRQVGFVVEWFCLLAAVLTTLALHPQTQGGARIVVIGILAFGMGIQNAMLRRWGVPNLATNVMTLTMTALIADSQLAGG